MFVQADPGVNSRDDLGISPLQNVSLHVPGLFEHSMEQTVALRVQSHIGTTATQMYQTKIRILFAHGVDIDARDYSGPTILHLSCVKDNKAAVKHLLSMGADPHLEDCGRCNCGCQINFRPFELPYSGTARAPIGYSKGLVPGQTE